jgi:hypothetical protein
MFFCDDQEGSLGQVCTPVIPGLWRLRQEDSKFKANLSYIDPISKQQQQMYVSHKQKL